MDLEDDVDQNCLEEFSEEHNPKRDKALERNARFVYENDRD